MGSGGKPENDGGSGVPPNVAITDPAAVSDPNAGVILSSDTNKVTVTCTVDASTTLGARPIDASSVTLEMLDANEHPLTVPPQLTVQSTLHPDQFSADFVYTNVPNGKVFFRCKARDKGGATGTDTIGTFVDHGPAIVKNLPEPNSPHALKTALQVDFTISEDRLANTDPGAAVESQELLINGQNVPLTDADLQGAGHYVHSVNLNDFPKLNGSVPIAISATNHRGVKNTVQYFFIADGAGPVITITSPNTGDIIGARRVLQFTVADMGSGVKKDSVSVTVNKVPYSFDMSGLWSEMNGAYTFQMDASQIPDVGNQINVIVSASDTATNSSQASASYYLDTLPPAIDLDPGLIQEVKLVNAAAVCSIPFDPVGPAALNDFDPLHPETVQGFATIRAFVYDLTNLAPGQMYAPFSGVDPSSVRLYVQGNPDAGVLINTDGDPECDDVDTTLPSLNMYAVAPQGSSDYEAKSCPTPDTCVSNAAIANVCAPGTDTNAPQTLCMQHSDMTRVMQHDQQDGPVEDVIYSVQPQGECNKSQIVLSTLSGVPSSGWACLAVRAQDKAQNFYFSRPLRVCLQSDPMNPPACASMSVDPPSCTKDCSPPKRVTIPPYVNLPR